MTNDKIIIPPIKIQGIPKDFSIISKLIKAGAIPFYQPKIEYWTMT